MCGIVGHYWGLGAPEGVADVTRMARTIAHRGPDSDGFTRAPFAHVGFRRLSIIDLAGGHQPLANEDGTIECFLNGEIYNYRTLRDELVAKGHRFHTNSDTEVLPHLYEEFGDGMFERLNGMFSVCVVDRRARRVLVARDHFGVKQVYFARTGRGVVFASEVKGLLASGLVEPELDATQALAYLTLFYCPEPRTLLKGVEKLAPGSVLRLEEGREAVVERFYELPRTPRVWSGSANLAEETLRLVREAVELQLNADVPVGISLSGGVDSSAVAYAAATAESATVKPLALTISWADTDPEELAAAKALSKQLGLKQVVLTPELAMPLDELPHLAWMADEPIADPALFSQYLIAKAAREHVTVLLTGTGGDELFGGYGSYRLTKKDRALVSMPRAVREGLRALGVARWSDEDHAAAIDSYAGGRGVWHGRAMSSLSRKDQRRIAGVVPGSRDPYERMLQTFAAYGKYDHANQQMLADLQSYLPDQLLPMTDRATMAASIEARVPFLDVPLVEFAFSLTSMQKMGQPPVPKALLKRALRGRMPDGILDRRKLGLPSPFATMLGSEFKTVRSVLLAADSVVLSLVPREWLESMLESAETATRSWRVLYSMLVLEAWHRLFVREKRWERPGESLRDWLKEPATVGGVR